MSVQTISVNRAEHYKWGGPDSTDCDGWHLVKTSNLSIIEELMPPGTSESRHSHNRAHQFFFILEGELTMEVDHDYLTLGVGEGIEVLPGQQHQAINRSETLTRMIVTSQPPSHGDRVPAI